MNPFHKWLIRQRIYCEHNTLHTLCMNKGEVVQKIHGRDTVLCREHAERHNKLRPGPLEQGYRVRQQQMSQ